MLGSGHFRTDSTAVTGIVRNAFCAACAVAALKEAQEIEVYEEEKFDFAY